MRSVCVFCGSSPGSLPEYRLGAEELGRELLDRGLNLVYGGASFGLMGRLADTVLSGGGKVIGVMPSALVGREIAHTGLSDLRVVDTMHERKALMADLSDAFVAMPGGLGTVEELLEMLTWAQLDIHHKPCGVLNLGGYFDHLLAFLDVAADHLFLTTGHRSLLLDSDQPAALLEMFRRSDASEVDKAAWIRKVNGGGGDEP